MPEANLILHNANVVTMDDSRPRARMVAIRNGKVLAVLQSDDIASFKGAATKVINCRGMTVLPGFHDAHCHVAGFAEVQVCPDLSRPIARSIADIQHRLREVAKNTPPGEWVRARGYSEFYLAEQRQPNRWDLDEATTAHPVKLTHRSGHAHILNSLALKLTGIDIDTPEPPGGIIDRDTESGEPNGILYEMGSYLAERIPSMSDAELERGMKLANEQLVSLGITSVQDASVRNGKQRWQKFQQWKSNGSLQPRVTMMIGAETIERTQEQELIPRMGDDQLRLGAVKIIVHTATGRLSPPQEELEEKVLLLHQLGFQAAIHAMEEVTIEAACQALEKALHDSYRADHRHRIEHCSLCRPATAGRLVQLGAVVVTQPAFIYYNGERYIKTITTDDIAHLYPVATFLKAGLKVGAGSDCPVVPPNPLNGIYAAVTRTAEAGYRLAPEQCVTVEEALQTYTRGAAYSCFEEDSRGSIAPGTFADLVVLSGDPTMISPDEIKELTVKMTVVDGEVVWRKDF